MEQNSDMENVEATSERLLGELDNLEEAVAQTGETVLTAGPGTMPASGPQTGFEEELRRIAYQPGSRRCELCQEPTAIRHEHPYTRPGKSRVEYVMLCLGCERRIFRGIR